MSQDITPDQRACGIRAAELCSRVAAMMQDITWSENGRERMHQAMPLLGTTGPHTLALIWIGISAHPTKYNFHDPETWQHMYEASAYGPLQARIDRAIQQSS